MFRLVPARPRSVSRWFPVLMLLGPAFGCGADDGSQRLSGTVTFQGVPVPAGKIYFSPDGSKGNTGATGYADIKDGSYDTSASGSRGVGKGPVVVGIEGYDPSKPGPKVPGDMSGEVTVLSLFPRYETTLDVTGTMTKDFDVPASAANPRKVNGRPIAGP